MSFATGPNPTDLMTLPWSTPLEDWPADQLVSLPRGISRHIVRFTKIGVTVYAVKEIEQATAYREYTLLRSLEAKGVPTVKAMGVVADRRTPEGEPLDAALVTKHLRFSLPYRALFSRRIDPDLEGKLLDALAELIVRLHLVGFAWGDCSLSNTLFRRDAGALAAYLVDAETGVMREQLSDGQRDYDIELAQTNLTGELLDLQAAGLLPESVDPIDTAVSVGDRYGALWRELTGPQTYGGDEWDGIADRLHRLNRLGYDVGQIEVTQVEGRPEIVVHTQVVEAGHHARRLQELTGLEVQENQARRILNDLDTFRAQAVMPGNDVPEEVIAQHWLSDVYKPVIAKIPPDQRGKLEEAEVFHEVLEHRWFLSEAVGHPVSLAHATASYVISVLPQRPEEQALLDPALMGLGESTSP